MPSKPSRGGSTQPKVKARTKTPAKGKGKRPGAGARPPIASTRTTPATVRTSAAKARVIQSIIVNRHQAYNYATAVGQRRLFELLQAARLDLMKRLTKVSPALMRKGAFTPTAMRATLAQIEDLMKVLTPKVGAGIVDAKRVAMALGRSDALGNLLAMDTRFAGVASLGRFDVAKQLDPNAKGRLKSGALRRLATLYPKVKPGKGIMERYGMQVIESFEHSLRVAAVTGKPWPKVREDLIAESEWLQSKPMSWAQRIVRTETMGAYNRSILDSGEEANKVVGGDMVKILVAGFDDRTSWDSYQVHGQIRRLDEPFEWVDKHGTTHAYDTPPNRPNDREVIVFHRIAWPIPDNLKPLPDAMYESRFEMQNQSGAPPPRPKMSTVPRSKFGKVGK